MTDARSSWRKKSDKYLNVNFSRTISKLNSFISEKYSVPPNYFYIRDKVSQIRALSSMLSERCRKNSNFKIAHCDEAKETYNRQLNELKKLISIFINKLPHKVNYNHFISESILIEMGVFTEKKVRNASKANLICLELDSLLTNYLLYQIPKESFNHINEYLVAFDNVSILLLNEKQLAHLTNTVNYFIRKEREDQKLSKPQTRGLELINLFWNNVLKIKKDQR